MITAPYNFVPLNKEVFYPSWSEDVSHDIPFEDSESGEIDITITAKSPIFIRNHSDERDKPSEEFCQYNGEYYIPSTTVKGMVRSVLEIISFSKMNPDMVDDKTYSIRDLRNRDLYMNRMKPQEIFCGWLKKVGNDYKIEDCGVVGRISQDNIHKDFGSKFKAQQGGFINKPDFKTAKYKYDLLKKLNIELTQKFDFSKEAQGKKIYTKGTKLEGTLVLTGQASARKDNGRMGDGKIYEFVFFNAIGEITLSKETMENFKFAYFDGRKTEPKESPDWKYWKEKLANGQKVPVFFQKEMRKDSNGQNQTIIKHFGLSYLYKLPYNGSIHDGIFKSHFEKKLDLAQTLFGYVNNDTALKGRVQFSHFKAIDKTKIVKLAPRTENLGTPRASFYPFYIFQEDGKLYSTFMNDNFVLAGRKRYPIHKNNPDESKISYNPTSSIGTSFKPLKEGVIFKGKMRYHNLKKCEIGALLSALTFHSTPNTFHNVGLGKSLGYGKINLTIHSPNKEQYLQEFETLMKENINNWMSSNILKELLTMATPQDNQRNSQLSYMELADFAQTKNDKINGYLKNYSKLDNIVSVTLSSPSPQKQQTIQVATSDTISKTKMRKTITEAWQRVFGIFYHPHQIEEFLKGAFQTTPTDQQQIYLKLKDNHSFIELIRMIHQYNNGHLNDQEVGKLYLEVLNMRSYK